jgi:hypothetical protein
MIIFNGKNSRQNHHSIFCTADFTLIELLVVIAIMPSHGPTSGKLDARQLRVGNRLQTNT